MSRLEISAVISGGLERQSPVNRAMFGVTVKKIFFVSFLFVLGLSNFERAFSAEKLELTKSGVEKVTVWDGASISLLGVFVGQDGAEAESQLRQRRLTLSPRRRLGSSKFANSGRSEEIFDVLKGGKFSGMSLVFVEGRVLKIFLQWDSEFWSKKSHIGGDVKGVLKEILYNYSDRLRLSVFGEPNRTIRHGENEGVDFSDYYYDCRGVAILVQRSGSEIVLDKGDASVELVFFDPVLQ